LRFTVPNIRTEPRSGRLQQGQVIVLLALLMLVLMGMLGLAIDSGRAYVDRRDLQTAVDAAALAAGDWHENYHDLYGSTLPKSKTVFQNNLRLYSGPTSDTTTTTYVGPNANLQQDTDVVQYAGGYQLTIVATNTQFNGYQFQYTTTHSLPLAFMQVFGIGPSVSISATATAIIGNQRSQPALLTLSTASCSLTLTGSATLTVLGDTYSNGASCVGAGLQEAGNCYSVGGNCSAASYWCYNSTPGFVPYPPPCHAGSGDTQGAPTDNAPTLPDPGYLAGSQTYYTASQSYSQNNRGTWTEMLPGQYGTFHLTGGSASCAFLDPGVYTWTGGYQSDASGSLLSNELKPPDEGLSSAPGTTSLANPQFWNQNSTSCSGEFNLSVVTAPSNGIKHQGGSGNWGIELTSVRWDTFADSSVTPNPCYTSPGCKRESAPSACEQIATVDTNNPGINVNITRNAPGAQYYNAYMNPNGCDGIQANFSFLGRYKAPGWTDGGGPPASPAGPWPNGSNTTLVNGVLGWACPIVTVTICNIAYNNLTPTTTCAPPNRAALCQAPDVELAAQCFSNCPPPAGMTQENAPMRLQYPPNTGGDVANENYCQTSPNPGNSTAPCATAKVTPGAVQFYFPAGSCMTQNAQGATYVFSGLQYNWIVIYMPGPLQGGSNTCSNTLNGGSSTQYIGTIYTPAAAWTINGGNRAPLAGQVIAFSAKVAGSASVGILFNPNYAPAPPAARLIN
jgi:Flp pilus assembly protein TadG